MNECFFNIQNVNTILYTPFYQKGLLSAEKVEIKIWRVKYGKKLYLYSLQYPVPGSGKPKFYFYLF